MLFMVSNFLKFGEGIVGNIRYIHSVYILVIILRMTIRYNNSLLKNFKINSKSSLNGEKIKS